MTQSALISPDSLREYLDTQPEKYVLLDASFTLPNMPMNAYQVYQSVHIGNAQYFDVDDISDHTSDLPHMLPTPEDFAKAVEALGISNDTDVIIYGQQNIAMGPARAWWMFRIFGHARARVLNGSLQHWLALGYPIKNGPVAPPAPGSFKPSFRPELVADKQAVITISKNKSRPVFDARPPERFAGSMPEPRPAMRAGHIPNSRSLPAGTFLDPATGGLKDSATVTQIIATHIPHNTMPVISCGSGITACIPALALYESQGRDATIYDGSWSEWGRETEDTEIEKS